MWQRKQTIFLAIAAASLILMIFFPVWQGKTESSTVTLYPLYLKSVQGEVRTDVYFPYSIIAILAIAAATLSIFEIGKFENRLLQIKIGTLNSLFMAGSMGTAAYLMIQVIKANQIEGTRGLALFLPGVAMISNVIANRFIRKDEKLVRDSERLR